MGKQRDGNIAAVDRADHRAVWGLRAAELVTNTRETTSQERPYSSLAKIFAAKEGDHLAHSAYRPRE